MTIIFFSILFGVILMVLLYVVDIRLWTAARAAGIPVGLGNLIGMRMRSVKPRAVVMPLIKAHMCGLTLSITDLETHYLCDGSVARVVDALIIAEREGIDLSFREAAAIDLAGRDILAEIKA